MFQAKTGWFFGRSPNGDVCIQHGITQQSFSPPEWDSILHYLGPVVSHTPPSVSAQKEAVATEVVPDDVTESSVETGNLKAKKKK